MREGDRARVKGRPGGWAVRSARWRPLGVRSHALRADRPLARGYGPASGGGGVVMAACRLNPTLGQSLPVLGSPKQFGEGSGGDARVWGRGARSRSL